jgi:hypothetical protein
MFMSLAATVITTLLLAVAAADAQIVNGSFEPATGTVGWQIVGGGSTAIPGWTAVDYGVEWVLGTSGGAPAPDGLHVVDLACYIWSAGGLQQVISTVPGEVYTVTFQLGTLAGSGRDGTCEIVVDADGQSQAFAHTNVSGTVGYATKAFAFLADDTSAVLRFRCLQNANLHFAYLDAVGLEAVVAQDQASFGAVKALFR